MEPFTKCIINCKSSFKSSTVSNYLSILTQQEVESAARHILDGEQTTNATLKILFTSIRGQSSSIGHSNEVAYLEDKSCFRCDINMIPLQFSSLLLHAMNAVFVLDYMLHPKIISFPV